jgi:hypothetical protein
MLGKPTHLLLCVDMHSNFTLVGRLGKYLMGWDVWLPSRSRLKSGVPITRFYIHFSLTIGQQHSQQQTLVSLFISHHSMPLCLPDQQHTFPPYPINREAVVSPFLIGNPEHPHIRCTPKNHTLIRGTRGHEKRAYRRMSSDVART